MSASPDSTFIFSESTTQYGASSYAMNTTHHHQYKDQNRKTVSTTNLLNNVDNSWNASSAVGGHDEQDTPCNDCDIIYNGHGTMLDGDGGPFSYHHHQQQQNQHHHHHGGDSFSLSAIKRPPSAGSGSASGVYHQQKGNYLIAVHRKLSRQDTYFLSHHKSRPGLFGVPLLIPCYDGVTNKELYCSVWLQVARLLSPLPPTPPDQSNHATDWYV